MISQAELLSLHLLAIYIQFTGIVRACLGRFPSCYTRPLETLTGCAKKPAKQTLQRKLKRRAHGVFFFFFFFFLEIIRSGGDSQSFSTVDANVNKSRNKTHLYS